MDDQREPSIVTADYLSDQTLRPRTFTWQGKSFIVASHCTPKPLLGNSFQMNGCSSDFISAGEGVQCISENAANFPGEMSDLAVFAAAAASRPFSEIIPDSLMNKSKATDMGRLLPVS